DATAWKLSVERQVIWRPATPTTEDHVMVSSKKHNGDEGRPVYIAGGNACGCLWVMDEARRLWSWGPSGRGAVGEAPVPLSGRVTGVDLSHKVAMLET